MTILEQDKLGAFCRHTHAALAGAPFGALSGLTFGVKDIYGIAGHRTGFGSPDWLRTHAPIDRTAVSVRRLLDAGASMLGRTQTDEMTYSLNGENAHYGTPINVAAPGRIPGGSSSGSAAAVAGKLCDFALGSDTGGSVRVPASYCGIFGMRPSHGRVSLEGACPLAPGFDTAGWFARDAALLERVGRVLLRDESRTRPASRLLIARDAFDQAGAAVTTALDAVTRRIAARFSDVVEVSVCPVNLSEWGEHFRILQGGEVWATHGAWVRAHSPAFGPGVRERFDMARAISGAQIADSQRARDQIAARMDGLLPEGTLLCLPTAPGIAPLRETPQVELNDFRARAISILCIAGLARLPQVTMPYGEFDGCPLGLSLLAGPGQDISLLKAVTDLDKAIGPNAALRLPTA